MARPPDGMWSRLPNWIKSPLSVEFAFAVLVSVVVYVWVMHLVAHGNMLSVVSATTEMVTYVVSDAETATFPVHGMARSADRPPRPGVKSGVCFNGLVRPVFNSSVTYSRVGYGPLEIAISPPRTDPTNVSDPNAITASLIRADGTSDDFRGLIALVPDETCDDDQNKAAQGLFHVDDTLLKTCGFFAGGVNPPLPIYGRVTIGTEFHAARNRERQPYLLSGTLKVAAQSFALPGFPEALYKEGDLDLPVASRLTAVEPNSGGSSDTSNWWGVCYCEPQKAALELNLATNAPKLELFRPNKHDADIIQVTETARIFDDPNLVKLYKITGIVAGAVALLGWFRERSKGER
jgi:hypothetical protein